MSMVRVREGRSDNEEFEKPEEVNTEECLLTFFFNQLFRFQPL